MIKLDWVKVTDKVPPEDTIVLVSGKSGDRGNGKEKFIELAYQAGPRWLNLQDDELSNFGRIPSHWAFNTLELPHD